jgi:PleD family two-component response regulator
MDRAAAAARVALLRRRLRDLRWHGPSVTFSVGLGDLPPGGSPDEALRMADRAMYEAKRTPGASTVD